MLHVPGNGFRLKVLDLETCPTSRVCVGRMNDRVYAWGSQGRLLQVSMLLDRVRAVLTETSEGRPTLVAAEVLGDGERLRPVHLRAMDVLTGVVRWRRKEKLIPRLASYTHGTRSVVRVEAPQGAHLFDVDSGMRLRAPQSELVPRRMRGHKRVPPALEAPRAEELPESTLRRDRPGTGHLRDADDDAIAEARREFFFRSKAPPRGWSRSEPTAAVWALVQELRDLEGRTPIASMPPRIGQLDLPPDVQALFAAESTALRTRWRIGADSLLEIQQSASQRLAPTVVRVFGQEAHPSSPDAARLLCAQATELGDRVGIYNGLGYLGPFPIETLLSETCWNVLEARRAADEDGDASCARMEAPMRRVLRGAAA